MPVIKRNNKEIHFNRVFAYGCSFTVGDETADYLLRPELTEEEVDKEKRQMGIRNWCDKYANNLSDKLYNKRAAETNSNSWANQLAQMFGATCINKAQSGLSMECILYNIEHDLATKEITENDIIVVGCTSMSRWIWINNDGSMQRLLMNWNLEEWPSEKFHEEFVKHANDFFLFYKYALCIRHLDLLSKHLNDRLMLFNCHFNIHGNLGSVPKFKDYPDFTQFIYSLCNAKSFVDEKFSFSSFIDWHKDTHGGMHPKKHHHKQFAEHFYNLLK